MDNTTEEKEKFICRFCDKPFSTKSNLKTHLKNTKKCLDLRKELTSVNGEITDEITTIIKSPLLHPILSPLKKGLSKSDSLEDLSSIKTLTNIESEINK